MQGSDDAHTNTHMYSYSYIHRSKQCVDLISISMETLVCVGFGSLSSKLGLWEKVKQWAMKAPLLVCVCAHVRVCLHTLLHFQAVNPDSAKQVLLCINNDFRRSLNIISMHEPPSP